MLAQSVFLLMVVASMLVDALGRPLTRPFSLHHKHTSKAQDNLRGQPGQPSDLPDQNRAGSR